jgi:hypothetical protein
MKSRQVIACPTTASVRERSSIQIRKRGRLHPQFGFAIRGTFVVGHSTEETRLRALTEAR